MLAGEVQTPNSRGLDALSAKIGDRRRIPGNLALVATRWRHDLAKGSGRPDFAVYDFDFVGGARRNRTDDLFNAIEALSQLSYGPIQFGRLLGEVPRGLPPLRAV